VDARLVEEELVDDKDNADTSQRGSDLKIKDMRSEK
jgi:hypothetical protein